ncbi:hypothetical protein KEM09_12650 [Carboxylicivirga mesophila]|uniref:histidine kinase n=1 Tax=Carboxylicivirga mesophila TaxID=1166478 RepID=A0ABS5KBA1_9BACT|nr:ATP-binding protein [Carboxylicivirga mesophila]MBS2212260.1 hypothetical protein [Carboxylicivirga mesophila]
MGIDYTFKGVVNSFNTVKGDIIDFSYLTITLLLGPLYAYNLYFEESPVLAFVLNSIVLLGLVVVVVFKSKIPIRVKTLFLLFVLIFGNLYSIYRYGFFGGGQYFMILIFGLSIFYYNRWWAIGINIVLVVYFFIYMHLYTTGQLQYDVSPQLLVRSKMVWLADFILTIVVMAIGGYAIRKTFIAYQYKVKEQHDSFKKFNYTLDNLPIPVAALTVDKRISYFNEAFYQYFGFDAEEIPYIEDWFRQVYPDPAKRIEIEANSQRQIKNGFREQLQLPIEYNDFLTKSGEVKSAEVNHTFLGDVAICAFIDLTERKRKRRLIVETMMKAEEKENKRIAQELHDGVGPLLSAAKIYAHSLTNHTVDADKEMLSEKLNELLNGALKELRNTINNVTPQILQKYGLARAVESFVNHIQPITSIQFLIDVDELSFRDSLIELAVYRALIELINNSIKYGSPTEIKIAIKNDDGGLVVSYIDNGVGFDIDQVKQNGFGLSNITNRIETIGGKISFNTGAGAGVYVEIAFKH